VIGAETCACNIENKLFIPNLLHVLCLPRQKSAEAKVLPSLPAFIIYRKEFFSLKNEKKILLKWEKRHKKQFQKRSKCECLDFGVAQSDKLCNKEAGFVVDEYLKLCDLVVCLRVGARKKKIEF
jgi:hypothetical protein